MDSILDRGIGRRLAAEMGEASRDEVVGDIEKELDG